MAGAEGLVRIPELRKRILLTLFLLAVYRIGVHVPTPGVDSAALTQFFQNTKGTIFSWFNLFSGGALERFSVFALGVMPYISSSIIFQLLTVVWPYLHELQKEGEQGRKKITQYTRYGTVILCLIQGYGISAGLEQMVNPPVVLTPGFGFRFLTMVTLTAGTVFLMWLGEQITERGIGNGVSLIIFAGIAAGIPSGVSNTVSLARSGELSALTLLLVSAIILGTFALIIFVERGQRRIPVQYAKRVVGRRVYGGQSTHLPLKINSAGVIPPIFASSLIMFPATIATFINTLWMQSVSSALQPGSMLHDVLYVGLIVFFCYFYTAVTFKTDDVAENMKKHGGYIPGIRPGGKTAEFIDQVLSRITLGGAIYISLICVLPTILAEKAKVPFYFGGTSVLILVGVALDTVAQIESFLLTRNYEGFVKGARIRSRRA
ncbi:MAG: preprotein translocase subunit SecY [Deltaproteobacteria bacterium]|nr:preprotein translocase subunit SecY [Deltaproteobacteria bacterium]